MVARPEPAPAADDRAFLPFEGEVKTGRLVRRYKRFFADVIVDESGAVVTAHTPNTGAMTGLIDEGNRVLLTHRPAPHRKLDWSLEAIHTGESWVGTNTYVANRLIKQAIAEGAIPDLDGYATVRPEAPFEVEHGRADFFLSGHAAAADAFVEVKSATLREGDLATWPDAVSERGRRHLAALSAEVRAGRRGVMVFLVQRTDTVGFAPAASVDLAYALDLADAYEAGLEIIALRAVVDHTGVRVGARLPVMFAGAEGPRG